jgi:hypothetical protein
MKCGFELCGKEVYDALLSAYNDAADCRYSTSGCYVDITIHFGKDRITPECYTHFLTRE